jgi:hypothetical protein
LFLATGGCRLLRRWIPEMRKLKSAISPGSDKKALKRLVGLGMRYGIGHTPLLLPSTWRMNPSLPRS